MCKEANLTNHFYFSVTKMQSSTQKAPAPQADTLYYYFTMYLLLF